MRPEANAKADRLVAESRAKQAAEAEEDRQKEGKKRKERESGNDAEYEKEKERRREHDEREKERRRIRRDEDKLVYESDDFELLIHMNYRFQNSDPLLYSKTPFYP